MRPRRRRRFSAWRYRCWKPLQGWPKLTPPASSATKGKRIFQLRTYESPSNGEQVRKVEMFHSGEFEIFLKAGFHPVFFGDTLFGSRLPNLTYMLSFADTAELEAKWDALPQRSRLEKAFDEPEVRVRPDCHEYLERDDKPARLFGSLRAGIGNRGKGLENLFRSRACEPPFPPDPRKGWGA